MHQNKPRSVDLDSPGGGEMGIDSGAMMWAGAYLLQTGLREPRQEVSTFCKLPLTGHLLCARHCSSTP